MQGEYAQESVAARLQRFGSHVATPDEALARTVSSGQRVFIATACGKPRALVEALVAQAERLCAVEVVHAHTAGEAPYVAPGMERHFRHRALFVGANTRAAVNTGRADGIPIFLSDVPALFASGHLPLDVALVQVSPPDEHGFCSLGLSVDITKAGVEHTRTVVAQVNTRLPRTLGDSIGQGTQPGQLGQAARLVQQVAHGHVGGRLGVGDPESGQVELNRSIQRDRPALNQLHHR